MITSVVAGLHSSAVKLTMIRRRSRALTHRTFPLSLSPSTRLFSRPISSIPLFFCFFSSPPRSRTPSRGMWFFVLFYRLLLPRTGRKSLSRSRARARLSTPLRAPRVPRRSLALSWLKGSERNSIQP